MARLSIKSALAGGLAVLLAGCTGQREESARPVLRFTAIPDQNSTDLQEKFKPLVTHLSRELGVPVEYAPVRDYQAAVELFKNGDVLLAWYGGLTGVQAREAVPGARAIAQGDADPHYVSYFIAHEQTGLELSDAFPVGMGGLRFTFGSEQSTSGRLMPEYFIRRHTGKSPEEFFTHPVGYSGSHDKTAELVATGQYEAGVLNFKVYERRVQEGKTDPAVVRVIWRSPSYADYNWTAHPELEQVFGAGFTEKLTRVLLAIDDPRLLTALPRDRLIPASNEQYADIRDVALELGMLRLSR